MDRAYLQQNFQNYPRKELPKRQTNFISQGHGCLQQTAVQIQP